MLSLPVRWKTRLLPILLPAILGCASSTSPAPEPKDATAEWTILVYMVADNDLDPFAIEDFEEMAAVGSTNDLNIVVQLDRAVGKSWSDTRRFLIQKGQSIDDPLEELGEINMGDPSSLAQFIRWGLKEYPARKTAVVIWNHGAGWRDVQEPALGRMNPSVPTPFKFVGSDDTDQDALYTAEIDSAFTKIGTKVDLIGFDACLMAMLEVWHSLRSFGHYGIASQDLEPAIGWKYDAFLAKLAARPAMSAEELSQTIVDTYAEEVEAKNDFLNTDYTLSVVELGSMEALSDAVSALASNLLVRYSERTVSDALEEARMETLPFAFDPKEGWPNGIDLDLLLSKLEGVENQEAARLAATAREKLRQSIKYNRSSYDAASKFGAAGLSIYFPIDKSVFESDPHHRGYQKGNKDYPVPFVDETQWPSLLQAYLKKKESGHE